MKKQLKQLLGGLGLRLLTEPAGVPMGYDLWRDLGIFFRAGDAPFGVDAGANHGEFTAGLLQLAPAACVHAFEPSAACVQQLRQRFAAAPGVKVFPEGLGDVAGQLKFHRYANDHLGSFLPLETGEANPFVREPELARETLPVTTLDEHAARHGVTRIDLLKVDTQGYDLRVLRGASRLLAAGAIKHVLVELNYIPLYQGQPTPAEICAYLAGHHLHLVDQYEKCRRDQRLAWCTSLFKRVDP